MLERLWAVAEEDHAQHPETAGSCTVRQVHEALARDREVAYTTVMTVLDRLAKKGLVAQEKDGRAYRYRAAATRGEMTADLMREALEEFGSGDRRTALVAFVGDASAEERAALREALTRLEEG